MLTSKTFLRKNKRGNVLKIVREHYLRDDLSCGSELCDECDAKEAILEKTPTSNSKQYTQSHYLLLDTNIILQQIDVLEEPTLCNIIVIQTILQEVKHRSSSVYKRLKDLIANPNRKFYVFVNEHHHETYIERNPGESMNDRNDRALRRVASWYEEHLVSRVRVILLTADARNKELATGEGLLSCSIEAYISQLTNGEPLLDKLSKIDAAVMTSVKDNIYPVHATPTEIHAGVKNKTLLQGSFQASRENFLEGQVNCEGYEKPILVQGRDGLNRAIDGDTVAVRLLPEDQWSAPLELVLEDEGNMEDDEGGEEGKELKKKKSVPVAERRPTGLIVGIIKQKWRQYCGILQANPMEGSSRHLFVPAERKIPKIRVETRQIATLSSQRIVVAIDSWPRHSRYPQGHFVRALGPIGDKDTENEVLLLEHDVPHSKFSDLVLSYLPQLPWSITDDEVSRRSDLRYLDVCSVDPPGCTDIDDALHCRPMDNGNLEVGVHIADVSHFIKPGTPLDEEAALRATTVYLVDKRIDMVPGLLSGNLCSLRGNEERLAFSVIWELTEEARIVNAKFCKSVIRSRAALTYEQAQLIIDDPSQETSIATSLRGLNRLAKILKKRRMDNGALVLASPEIRFHMDSETHEPLEVVAKKMRETNSMVEEFMLLANITVAEKIFHEFPDNAMLRRHPVPPPANFEPLIHAAKRQGFELNVSTGKDLATSLDEAVKPDNPYFNTMLRIIATRCMLQAVYFSSGMLPQSDFHHYGLAAPIYTHFTSPIRRYADIIVHRLLAACIGADATYPALLDKKASTALCYNLNYRNRQAQYAGRASVALHTHLFFRSRVQDEDGYVLYVRKNALQILIPKYGLEGTLFLRCDSPGVSWTYNEKEQCQSCGDVVFHSFDPVTVQLSLDRSNVQHEKLVLKLVHPIIVGYSVPSSQQDEEMKGEQEEAGEKEQEGGGVGGEGEAGIG
uniref:Protein DIS3 homolog n=1 Tax=Cacopsylla melanoneura TaxID=428564 RepID=A0A8D9BV86_9HEMI